MEKTTKIVIGVAGGILLLCICVVAGGILLAKPGLERLAEELVIEDPEEIRALAEEMAGYELPPGYREEVAMNLFGLGRMVLINANDGRPVIAFWEINSSYAGSEEELRSQMQQSVEQQMNRNTSEMTLKEERSITIAGEETSLFIYEGTDGTGGTVRQWITTFEGNDNLVLVMIMGPADDWNETELTAFLQSIH